MHTLYRSRGLPAAAPVVARPVDMGAARDMGLGGKHTQVGMLPPADDVGTINLIIATSIVGLPCSR